jgi:hypothetical protein
MGKILATFRIEESDWQEFKELAESQGASASALLNDFIATKLGRDSTAPIPANQLEKVTDELRRDFEAQMMALKAELLGELHA